MATIPPPSTEPPAEEEDSRGGNTLMKIGTVVVIGAMAANVIGFRYSRWAVGKDVHRAWVNRERAQEARRARERLERERMREREQQHEYLRREQMKWESEQRQEQRSDQQQRARQDQERVHEVFEEWERAFGTGNVRGKARGYRVEIDNEGIEELLRRMNGFTGPRGFSRGFPGGRGFADEMFEEFIRAAQAAERAEKGRRGQGDGYESFRYWQQNEGQGGFGGFSGREGVFGRDNRRHYETLGLKTGASGEEIKRAYLKEVMKWHPDRYRGKDKEGAARKFREVTEAYDALKG